MDNNNRNERPAKEKSPLNLRALKGGSYSLGLCAAALVLVIVVNLFVSALPSTVTKLDATTVGMLSITPETKEIVKGVKEKVTMYLIAQRGREDTSILELMQRYADLNSNIKLETVDPDLKPGFTSRYTTSTLAANSVIVESEKRFYTINYSDIYVTSYENLTEEDLYNYYYYGIAPKGTPYFYGEKELTSAVDYVTAESIPTVYLLSGHGEAQLSESAQNSFTVANIRTASLALLGAEGIPEDGTAILVNNPQSDLSAFEAETLEKYLKNNGNLILVTDFRTCPTKKMPNLMKVTAVMGMRAGDGIVVETNKNNYNTYPTYLLPSIGTAGPGAELDPNSVYVFAVNAHSITLTGEGGAEAGGFLRSTTASFLKKAGADIKTYEREDGDTDGPCNVAAYATLGGGKAVWFATPSILEEQWDYYVNGGNSRVFMAAVNWMCEKTVDISILGKQLQVQALVVPEGAAGAWSVLLAIILPVAVLGGGIFIWYRRNHR